MFRVEGKQPLISKIQIIDSHPIGKSQKNSVSSPAIWETLNYFWTDDD